MKSMKRFPLLQKQMTRQESRACDSPFSSLRHSPKRHSLRVARGLCPHDWYSRTNTELEVIGLVVESKPSLEGNGNALRRCLGRLSSLGVVHKKRLQPQVPERSPRRASSPLAAGMATLTAALSWSGMSHPRSGSGRESSTELAIGQMIPSEEPRPVATHPDPARYRKLEV